MCNRDGLKARSHVSTTICVNLDVYTLPIFFLFLIARYVCVSLFFNLSLLCPHNVSVCFCSSVRAYVHAFAFLLPNVHVSVHVNASGLP